MGSPSWHSAITQDTWGALPNSNLNASGVLDTTTGSNYVVDAWSGAVIATGGLYIGSTFTAGTFFVVWGGGHSNYDGNEVYAYGPFEDNSPTWHRIRDRTTPSPTDVETDANGNPPSRHTYSAFVAINDGTRNGFYSMGSLFTWFAANSYSHVLKYNFNQASPNSNQPFSLLVSLRDAAITAAYEASSSRVWYHGNAVGHVGYWDVVANTDNSSIYASNILGSNPASCIDSVRGIWAMWSTNGINFYRTNNGVGNDYYVPTTTGTAPTSGDGSIVYDAGNDCFWVWIGGGKQIWKLKAPATNPYQGGNAWTWTSSTPSTGSTPDAQNTNGTFGRFNRIENADIIGMPLMNAYNGTMYFYKSGPSVVSAYTPKSSFVWFGDV